MTSIEQTSEGSGPASAEVNPLAVPDADSAARCVDG
jgi:hypothetical protein